MRAVKGKRSNHRWHPSAALKFKRLLWHLGEKCGALSVGRGAD